MGVGSRHSRHLTDLGFSGTAPSRAEVAAGACYSERGAKAPGQRAAPCPLLTRVGQRRSGTRFIVGGTNAGFGSCDLPRETSSFSRPKILAAQSAGKGIAPVPNNPPPDKQCKSSVRFGVAIVLWHESSLYAAGIVRDALCCDCVPFWLACDCEGCALVEHSFAAARKRRRPVSKKADWNVLTSLISLTLTDASTAPLTHDVFVCPTFRAERLRPARYFPKIAYQRGGPKSAPAWS